MIRKLMGRFFKPARSIVDNEAFIRIIQLADEDPTVRNDIIHILHMNLSKRNYALTKIAMAMRQNSEPEEIIEAVSSLNDEKLAQKILDYLTK